MKADYIQSDLWKQKVLNLEKNDGDLSLPLFIYCDDFELNIPLSSRRDIHKVGDVHLKIPSIPNRLQSQLISHYVSQLFFTEVRKRLDHLFWALNELSKGFPVCDSQYNVLRLHATMVLGDNLGINFLFGFSEGHVFVQVLQNFLKRLPASYKLSN
jgi:hypothetical protein